VGNLSHLFMTTWAKRNLFLGNVRVKACMKAMGIWVGERHSFYNYVEDKKGELDGMKHYQPY